MSRLLVIAFDGHEVESAAGFAKQLGCPWDLVVLSGSTVGSFGAEKVSAANLTEIPPADALAKSLAGIAGGYSHIAAASSMQAKDVLPRLTALIDGVMVTDATAMDTPSQFRRPVVAGSAIASVEVGGSPIVLTVRPAGFPKVEAGPAVTPELLSLNGSGKARRLSASGKSGGRPDLTQAKVVVSGGRPLKDAETFEKLIGGLADRLGGAVGATRAAVDSGIAPNECQVGQTGKIVAPDLYIAAGISGSTQHMAGIKDSKVIVAINKDPDAPIFEVADIGIVADLYDVIPALMERLP
ncbi:MAG: Electron transfer flavoprotein subunit alpha [Fimbriimonadaceae bacterium]|nr:Electron transfer flavoprotein subunit alpha [Fimbriimonadaceae bacterium]